MISFQRSTVVLAGALASGIENPSMSGRDTALTAGTSTGDGAILQAAIEAMDLGLLVVGADGRVTICNRRAIAMLDLRASLMARRPMFEDLMWGRLGENNPHLYDWRRPCGMVIEVRGTPLQDGGTVYTLSDVTERRRTEERNHYLARHDELTRLPNRAGFRELLDDVIADRLESLGPFALFYLDLDHFKNVNDTHGHAAGDCILKEVSARLRDTVHEGDTVARIGGDEFCIIACDGYDKDSAATLASRLLRRVERPYEMNGHRMRIGLSIGIALFPTHGTRPSTLLRNADAALYEAKKSGRKQWGIFDRLAVRSEKLQADHRADA